MLANMLMFLDTLCSMKAPLAHTGTSFLHAATTVMKALELVRLDSSGKLTQGVVTGS